MDFYHVRINDKYVGRWWFCGGDRLWDEFAADPVDTDFEIPQVSFMQFLARAQQIVDWEKNDLLPIVWEDSKPVEVARRQSR